MVYTCCYSFIVAYVGTLLVNANAHQAQLTVLLPQNNLALSKMPTSARLNTATLSFSNVLSHALGMGYFWWKAELFILLIWVIFLSSVCGCVPVKNVFPFTLLFWDKHCGQGNEVPVLPYRYCLFLQGQE